MRSLADRYRDLFPALIGDSIQDPDTGMWRHAFVELTPAGPDAYTRQPGARSGSTSINYALELNNHRAAPGTAVWMRHRDEQQVVHFEFFCGCSCSCSICYQGVDVTGPALPWIDADGAWQAVDLTAPVQGAVMISGGEPSVSPLYGSGAPAAGVGVPGSIYFDVSDPANPLFWWKD